MSARAARPLIASFTAALSALAVSVLLCVTAHAAPTFPQLTGRIVDEAGILSAEDRSALEAELKALEE